MTYTLARAREAGMFAIGRRMLTHNACKTCAVGMAGMRNERGGFPEICKKSVQAQAADMQPPIAERFFAEHSFDDLATLDGRRLEALGRIGFPLVARDGDRGYRRADWDQALDLAEEGLRAAGPTRTFFYASGRSSNEAGFLFQTFARLFGSNNVTNCSDYCHNASGVALAQTTGTGTATITLDDLASTELAIVIGANPASNHPRLITQLVELRRRGGHVIVVNPYREVGLERFRVPSDWRSLLFGSRIADVYLQPHVGADIPLLVWLLRRVIERRAVDDAYVAAYTSGWEALRVDVLAQDPDALASACGVPPALLEAAADAICGARRGIVMWAMGITQHEHGVDNVHALANLALARGWVGRNGGGLLPIRGHSNVQGVGSMGVAPVLKAEFARRMAALWNVTLPEGRGWHTLACLEHAAAGNVDAALLLGGNLFSASPDRPWSAAAMRRIGTTIFVSTKLNESHVHGRGRTSIVLPALARDEEPQCTTQESMFNFVRVSAGGGRAASEEMRSETAILAELASRVVPPGPVDLAALGDHDRLREAIARVVPGYGAVAAAARTRREFHVGGRTFHTPEFATPDRRARFHVVRQPVFAPADGELRLTTVRSEGQFNTIIYEDADVYRGNERRDVAMMNAEDMRRLGLARDDRVRLVNAVGALELLARPAPLPPGNVAIYYPEGNALIPRRIDGRSSTPVFKSATVRAERVGPPPRR